MHAYTEVVLMQPRVGVRRLVLAAVVAVLLHATPALALFVPEVPASEPNALGLLSIGAGLAVIGVRWLRRK